MIRYRRILLPLCLLIICRTAPAQAFVSLGYGGGIAPFEEVNRMIEDYNTRNFWLDRKMTPVQATGGPHLGAGYYLPRLLLELQYTWDGFTRYSSGWDGNGLSSIRNFKLRYNHISFYLGARPFETRFISLGLALNMGSYRTLFSAGNGYSEIGRQFSLGNEAFVDFLLVHREKFGFRLRPYFQFFYRPLELSPLHSVLGDPNSGQAPPFLSGSINHFGLKLSVLYLTGT